MNRQLFWKLCLSLCVGSVLLVYCIAQLSLNIERDMSLIAEHDKRQLRQWRDTAETLLAQDAQKTQQWLEQLRLREGVYAAILQHQFTPLPVSEHGLAHPDLNDPMIGRHVDWGIHLYHPNPLINLPFSQKNLSLVVELPQRMRPGRWWPSIHFLLHTIVPLLLMALISGLLYRHLMRPLQQLEQATKRFAAGDYQTRLLPALGTRRDELAGLAASFDAMAERIGRLIQTQRHLINDLSHELRTPLQRLKLAISSKHPERETRLMLETDRIQQLVEDTLTLALLDNQSAARETAPLSLPALLESLVEDARFEYSDRRIALNLPDDKLHVMACDRGLSQALENILRNALRHTPVGGCVDITAECQQHQVSVAITDQGPGVEPELLEKIFQPFFRVDTSRKRDGFGLGLALARRQLSAMGAEVSAHNTGSGLQVRIAALTLVSASELEM